MTAQAHAMLRAFADLGATDTTCFLGHWPYRLGSSTDADGLRAHAARLGLRQLWVSHLASLFGFDTRTGNEAVLAQCGDDPLFRLFATVDPGQPSWRTEVAQAASAGFHGIRLAPGFHRRPVADALPVLDAAAAHDLPVQIVVRLDDARVRHPLAQAVDPEPHQLADLVRDRAGQRIVVSGLNRAEAVEFDRHLGGRVPQSVRLDLWHVNGPTFVADGLSADLHRWTFGTAFPVQTPEATALPLAASSLSPLERRAICVDNAAAVLRPSGRTAAAPPSDRVT